MVKNGLRTDCEFWNNDHAKLEEDCTIKPEGDDKQNSAKIIDMEENKITRIEYGFPDRDYKAWFLDSAPGPHYICIEGFEKLFGVRLDDPFAHGIAIIFTSHKAKGRVKVESVECGLLNDKVVLSSNQIELLSRELKKRKALYLSYEIIGAEQC